MRVPGHCARFALYLANLRGLDRSRKTRTVCRHLPRYALADARFPYEFRHGFPPCRSAAPTMGTAKGTRACDGPATLCPISCECGSRLLSHCAQRGQRDSLLMLVERVDPSSVPRPRRVRWSSYWCSQSEHSIVTRRRATLVVAIGSPSCRSAVPRAGPASEAAGFDTCRPVGVCWSVDDADADRAVAVPAVRRDIDECQATEDGDAYAGGWTRSPAPCRRVRLRRSRRRAARARAPRSAHGRA